MRHKCLLVALVMLCGCGQQQWTHAQVEILKAEAMCFACHWEEGFQREVLHVELGAPVTTHKSETVVMADYNVHDFFHESYHVIYQDDDDKRAEQFAAYCMKRHRWE